MSRGEIRRALREMDPTTRVDVLTQVCLRLLEGKPLRVECEVNERRTSETNRTYKLTPQERNELFILWSLGLWSNTALGVAYGVDRSIVYRTAKTRRLVE